MIIFKEQNTKKPLITLRKFLNGLRVTTKTTGLNTTNLVSVFPQCKPRRCISTHTQCDAGPNTLLTNHLSASHFNNVYNSAENEYICLWKWQFELKSVPYKSWTDNIVHNYRLFDVILLTADTQIQSLHLLFVVVKTELVVSLTVPSVFLS
jgi:hypothetical protein